MVWTGRSRGITYAAALSLGWDRIAAVTVDVAPVAGGLYRIMLADNRTADLGGYDDALLLDLLPRPRRDGYATRRYRVRHH